MKNVLNIFFLLLCLQCVFANNGGDETACISFVTKNETVEVEIPITYVQSTVIVFAGQVGTTANTPPPYTPNTLNPSRLAYNTTFHVLWGFNGGTWQKIPLNGGVSYTAGAGIAIVGTVISNTGDLSAANECNTAFSVVGGDLQLKDNCSVLQIAVTDIAPMQTAANGLYLDADTVKLGGSLIETTDIYTAHNPFTISDTSVGVLGCQVDRSWGFDNYKSGFGLGYLNENIHTTYEVAGIKYYDELGQENCDGTIVSHKELYPTVGNDKTFTDFRRGQITNAYTDGVGTVNVLEVTNTNVKAFSAAPSGTTEITASGGAGKVQASDSLYLESGRVAYLVAPQKLYVQPNNVGTATVGDVFTMVGVNGEAEWKPKSNNAWLLNGNAGTDGGVTDFLGTTDAQNLVLKVDNTAIAKFHNGYLGIAVNDVSTNNANGLNSFVAGESNTINGEAGAAFGAGNTGVDFSFLTGQSNTDNVGAFVYGAENVVDGRFSMVSGFRNNVKSPYESVFGNLTTNYAAVNPNDWNINDRLFTIGNGDYNTNIRHNALTIYKDGRFILNTDTTNTTPIQNTWFGINGTLSQNFNHIRTPKDGTLAAFSTEHISSGNYAVFGSTAGNSGISINNTKQFVFTTTAGTSSTNLGPTTTIANYSNSGVLVGGGAAATSTFEVQGSIAYKLVTINANYAATTTDRVIVCNNGGTNITVTLPDPTNCIGRLYTVTRADNSNGNITVQVTGGDQIQGLNGNMGGSTTITGLGNHDDWCVTFMAATVGANDVWMRLD